MKTTQKHHISDPIEKIVSEALTVADIAFVTDEDPRNKNLDFYLPDLGIHIEVKQMHSPRISEQMARVENVIVIQGRAERRFRKRRRAKTPTKPEDWNHE